MGTGSRSHKMNQGLGFEIEKLSLVSQVYREALVFERNHRVETGIEMDELSKLEFKDGPEPVI